MNKKVIKEIDSAIKHIWKYEIKNDYETNKLLREDTLKNSLYFHLRTKLETLLDENNIKIFTEFSSAEFKGTGCIPDMVLVKLKDDYEYGFLGNAIDEYICVIELKYKGSFKAVPDLIYKDYDKLHHYIKDLNLNCPKYYMATIWEERPNTKQWLDNQAWAKGLVTELNADYGSRGNMQFYVKEH